MMGNAYTSMKNNVRQYIGKRELSKLPHGLDATLKNIELTTPSRDTPYAIRRLYDQFSGPDRPSDKELRQFRDVFEGIDLSQILDGSHSFIHPTLKAIATSTGEFQDFSVTARILAAQIIGVNTISSEKTDAYIRAYDVSTVFARPLSGAEVGLHLAMEKALKDENPPFVRDSYENKPNFKEAFTELPKTFEPLNIEQMLTLYAIALHSVNESTSVIAAYKLFAASEYNKSIKQRGIARAVFDRVIDAEFIPANRNWYSELRITKQALPKDSDRNEISERVTAGKSTEDGTKSHSKLRELPHRPWREDSDGDKGDKAN